VQTQFKKRVRIGQKLNALARRQPTLGMLVFDALDASAFAYLLALVAHLRHQIRQKTHVGLITRGGRIDLRGEHIGVRRVQCRRFVTLSHGSRHGQEMRTRTDYRIPRGQSRAMRAALPIFYRRNRSLARWRIRRTASATGSAAITSASPIRSAWTAVIFSAATNIARARDLPINCGNR